MRGMTDGVSWERWEALRTSDDADPIEVLEAIAKFQQYFKAIERQAVRAARAQGRTWNDIGAAVQKSRQAVWQSDRADQSDIKRVVEAGRSRNAEVRFKIGLDPF
jgi:hypothetical protein